MTPHDPSDQAGLKGNFDGFIKDQKVRLYAF